MGVPLKVDANLIEKVCSAVKMGASLQQATEYAGVSDRTLRTHMHKKPEIRAKIAQARAEFTTLQVGLIQRQATGSGGWAASAYLLDRLDRIDKPNPDGVNVAAAKRTVKAMKRSGRLKDDDSALEIGFLALADAVDRNPNSAAMWRQYLLALQYLRMAAPDDTSELDELFARLSTPLRDEENAEPSNTGSPGRTGRAGTRSASDAVAETSGRRRSRAPS